MATATSSPTNAKRRHPPKRAAAFHRDIKPGYPARTRAVAPVSTPAVADAPSSTRSAVDVADSAPDTSDAPDSARVVADVARSSGPTADHAGTVSIASAASADA